METVLDDLSPKPLWRHFAAIAAIPRASTKEAAARDYVLGQAARLGLEAIQDRVGNVVIRKPARPGREDAIGAACKATWTWSAKRTKARLTTSIAIPSG